MVDDGPFSPRYTHDAMLGLYFKEVTASCGIGILLLGYTIFRGQRDIGGGSVIVVI